MTVSDKHACLVHAKINYDSRKFCSTGTMTKKNFKKNILFAWLQKHAMFIFRLSRWFDKIFVSSQNDFTKTELAPIYNCHCLYYNAVLHLSFCLWLCKLERLWLPFIKSYKTKSGNNWRRSIRVDSSFIATIITEHKNLTSKNTIVYYT